MPATVGLEQGTLDFETPDFHMKLVKASQTVAALQPKGAPEFDFTPADRLEVRASNGYHHLGDLTLRLRTTGSGEWRDYATSTDRHPVIPLSASGDLLAAADLTPTLPADCPLKATRSWILDHGQLVLRFDLKNTTVQPVQIGALGIPMIFNNIITGRSLAQAHETCSFFDPYIGQDAGYLQVTRLSGRGPALLVVPEGRTPFEAYQPLDEPTRRSQTFEGAFAWMAHSRAYAENEWSKAQPWNPPTMATLSPGESRSYGVRFLVSDTIRNIEKTLVAAGRPVAVGLPGYVLPMGTTARLFLNCRHAVRSISVEPRGALTVSPAGTTPGGWRAYSLSGKTWGRARLTVTYEGDTQQSISYYVIKPAAQAVADLGRFLLTKQWFVNPYDPFHRSPSVMSYDREADHIVEQDSRVWIAGLGDEGGSGSWLAAAMKEFGAPDPDEVAKYEQFVDGVLWGGIQYKDGPNKYGVRKSMLFYEPSQAPGYSYNSSFNWGSWTSWNKRASEAIDRAYNYPHVVAAYWALYRLARNHPGLVTHHTWDWYLDHAYQTVNFLTTIDPDGQPRVGYLNVGLMEGDIFVLLLDDLKREGWTAKAAELESRMKARADYWSRDPYPFGSEMAWDSTGQEEVYAWCKYFGYDDKAVVALDSILGYMPTLPHWGYNGNARRYWDFLYGGKLTRIERQLHHYGSGLNAIPMLAEYRAHPDDFYLLRVGYGGTMGALTNIDQAGFASVAFHSFPSTLKWDAYSGDYGPNFFGHAVNTATYLIDHPEFGWQAFGGDVKVSGEWVKVKPADSFRMRVYVAPRGLWLTLDAGTFESIDVNRRTHAVRVGLSPASRFTPQARLRVEQPARVAGIGSYHPATPLLQERGAYTVPLTGAVTRVELTDAVKAASAGSVETHPSPQAPAERQSRRAPGSGLVFKDHVTPHWFADNRGFWYRNDLKGGAREFIVVDVAQGSRHPAFDHARLADSLSKAVGQPFKADRLPFDAIEFGDDSKSVRFEATDKVWQCDLTSYVCSPSTMPFAAPAAPQPAAREQTGEPSVGGPGPAVASPDGKWSAEVRDHNVLVRAAATGQETVLTQDGTEGKAYDRLEWSPNSRFLIGWRIEPGDLKEVYLIRSSPAGGGRAQLMARPYALPGDKFTTYALNVFDVAAHKQTKPAVDVYEHEWEPPAIHWSADGRRLAYEQVDRGHQRLRVIEVDCSMGSVRNIIDEKSRTFIWTAHTEMLNMTTVNWLHNTNEIVYVSEQDGWRHLYLIDVKTGTIENQITKGEWVVRGIDRIDEEKRQIWFRASGMNPDQDPYFVHSYRINFDGSRLVALTQGNGTHRVAYSPDWNTLIDTWSRVDMAPITDLRRTSDGALSCRLEEADITALKATGWKPPEVFVAKGRDGKTDIWGLISRPSKFDPVKKYPVLEQIYAGPQGAYVPKAFSPFNRAAAMTDLGFIVVQMDAMGTAFRSKAFHDVCWHNLKDAGFPDRILWHKAVAAKYPYYDLSRVGIYGTSAGGQNAAAAVLFHPEFYRAAVANSGCHDNRMDKASWNEQWMGYPVGPQYSESSNIDNAAKLGGKLFLIVGELDTNVPPESTLRFADALIAADKDFDLLVVPGADHGISGPRSAYAQRRTRDFFVRNLLGKEPSKGDSASRTAN